MAEIANGMPNLQKEMKNFHVIMIRENDKLEEMSQVLSRIVGAHTPQEGRMEIPMDIDQNNGTRKK